MAKFNVNTQAGQLSELQQAAQVQLPTEPTPEAAPTAAPQGNALERLAAQAQQDTVSVDPELQGQVDAGIEAGIQQEEALAQEADRQTIAPIAERAQDTGRVDRWLKAGSFKPVRSNASQQPDGNIKSRAMSMVNATQTGQMTLGLELNNTPAYQMKDRPQREQAEAIAVEKEGSLVAAIRRAGAVEVNTDGKSVPNPLYTQIASTVTENMIADLSVGTEQDFAADPIAEALGEDPTVAAENKRPKITKAQGNAALGQQIHQEYQRMQGVPVPEKLPNAEAETVGDAFKELWAMQNPTLVNRFVDPTTRQSVFQLTAAGEAALEAGSQDRKRLFPKTNVRPAKTPLPTGKLPGDIGQNVVKDATGKVGKVEFGRVMKEAQRNLAQVPNVVDKQRAKILYSTILPVLQSGDHNSWQAEINNFGPSKIKKYAASQSAQQRRMREAEQQGIEFNEEPYSPEATMAALTDKIAQEVRSVAMEREGANYLSYTIQAFNGRMSPQQSFFDPTTSKAVRFVTRNAVPAVAAPGSRVNKNLRQMYAMMLVKGADSKLPEGREQALNTATPQLEAWGDRLKQALTMTDAQYEAVSQAIEQGVPLQKQGQPNPDFPQVQGLQLDPEADAELIAAIESKGEDGPHFIDGLMDFADYAKANRAGKPHNSYFNAYIDGKTNGIASNGIQMGHLGTAEATGVVRKNVRELLDKGDIRDQLKNNAVESIRDGWDGNVAEFESELNDVAESVFSYRQLNKDTTMTFGYGKEISSFKKNISDTLDLLSQTLPQGDTNALDSNPTNWSKEQRNDYMQWQKGRLKEESTYDGYVPEILFHSSTQAALDSDTFRYRPVNVPNKASSGKGAGIFTHGYDADGSKFGNNVYAVIYDKTSPTYAGKEDTSATAIDEIFIPQRAVDEITRIWPPGPEVINQFQATRGQSEGTTEGDSYHNSLSVLDEKMTRDELAETLLNKYSVALREALSDDAIDSRQLMRASAMLHSATNSLMSIKSYTGMDLNLGRNVSTGSDGATKSGYRIYGEGGKELAKREAVHYETEATAAAARVVGEETVAGEYAYGGSLPGPVQSLDAATVAMTASGKSWKKLKDKSGGNPYLHTIYDAFKMDANGYDTVLDEVNSNWLEATMNWSYLEQTLDATKNKMAEFNEKMKNRPVDDPLSANEALYMNYMLQMGESASGNRYLKNFFNKLGKAVTYSPIEAEDAKDRFQTQQRLQTHMAAYGYDVDEPPTQPTAGQLKAFVGFLSKELNLRPRMEKMISKTNENKKKLKREIQKRGPVLQYYSH